MTPEFESLLNTMRPNQMRTVALASAIDAAALQSLSTAYSLGVARAILCGNEAEIKSVAQKNNIDILLLFLNRILLQRLFYYFLLKGAKV